MSDDPLVNEGNSLLELTSDPLQLLLEYLSKSLLLVQVVELESVLPRDQLFLN